MTGKQNTSRRATAEQFAAKVTRLPVLLAEWLAERAASFLGEPRKPAPVPVPVRSRD